MTHFALLIGCVFSLGIVAIPNNKLNHLKIKNNETLVLYDDRGENDPHVLNGPGGYNQAYLRSEQIYSETHFSMRNYFENLSQFQPENEFGSCGFISLISVMSYYDTFLNDNIVPSIYDFYEDDLETYSEAYEVSPGTKKEYYDSNLFSSYYDFCHYTMNDNLQSKLTVLRNQLISDTDNPTDFLPSTGADQYQTVLNYFYLNSGISVTFNPVFNQTQAQFETMIKSAIDNEKPIIVQIQGPNIGVAGNPHHSVVAYDYDETNIYANFGWGSYHTHSPLLDGIEYTQITCVCTIDYSNNSHTHSDNYYFGGKGHCGCGLNDEINIVNGNLKQNVPPTIYWMKNFHDSNEKYEVYLRVDYDDFNFIYYTNISENKITLSESQWSYFLQFYHGQGAFYLRRISSLTNYVVHETGFSWGIANAEIFTKTPNSYGFPDAYCWSEVETTHSVYDISFTTKRLRCGYIHNEFVNLSPRRANAGVAYLEFVFEVPIYKIEVNISFWSSNENTNTNNATGYIQYLNSNGYFKNVIDLYNDLTLSRDRTNQDYLYLAFPEETNAFRFYTTAEATGNSNLGRISIGELTIFGSGFEVTY